MAETLSGRRLRTRSAPKGAPRRVAVAGPPVLWSAEDLLRWVITVSIGGVVVVASWYVCAGDTTFSQQIGPTDAALAGLLLAAVGNLVWLLHGRRALGERRRVLLPDVGEATEPSRRRVLQEREDLPSVPVGAHNEEVVLVAGEHMERFHRPECPLASGRTGWAAMTRQDHESAGRRPCGVCRP
jgi:hypothetical protein